MEFYQVINNRRIVRELKAEPVPCFVYKCLKFFCFGMLPCHIGLGYPVENVAVVERVEHLVKSTLHFIIGILLKLHKH